MAGILFLCFFYAFALPSPSPCSLRARFVAVPLFSDASLSLSSRSPAGAFARSSRSWRRKASRAFRFPLRLTHASPNAAVSRPLPLPQALAARSRAPASGSLSFCPASAPPQRASCPAAHASWRAFPRAAPCTPREAPSLAPCRARLVTLFPSHHAALSSSRLACGAFRRRRPRRAAPLRSRRRAGSCDRPFSGSPPPRPPGPSFGFRSSVCLYPSAASAARPCLISVFRCPPPPTRTAAACPQPPPRPAPGPPLRARVLCLCSLLVAVSFLRLAARLLIAPVPPPRSPPLEVSSREAAKAESQLSLPLGPCDAARRTPPADRARGGGVVESEMKRRKAKKTRRSPRERNRSEASCVPPAVALGARARARPRRRLGAALVSRSGRGSRRFASARFFSGSIGRVESRAHRRTARSAPARHSPRRRPHPGSRSPALPHPSRHAARGRSRRGLAPCARRCGVCFL